MAFLFGTEGSDVVYGEAGNDILYGIGGDDFFDAGAGDDFIDAGVGSDRAIGADGNDTIYGNDGDDTLLGGDGADFLLGWNGNDTLLGDDGNDTLNGSSGSDVLIGGAGDDVYELTDRADSVFEAPDSGNDTLRTGFSRQLPANIENITLVGDRALNARGNASSNILRGNAARNRLFGQGGSDRLLGQRGNDLLVGGNGNDLLLGGLGRDRLDGGRGSDIFGFRARREGRDRIVDFAAGSDRIGISRSAFGREFRNGRAIAADQFQVSSEAEDSSDRFIYDRSSGALFFDPDGTGSSRQIQIATLASGLNLTFRNFVGLA